MYVLCMFYVGIKITIFLKYSEKYSIYVGM